MFVQLWMLAITKALDNLQHIDEDLQKTDVIWQVESAFIAALHHIHTEGKIAEKSELCETYLMCLKEVKIVFFLTKNTKFNRKKYLMYWRKSYLGWMGEKSQKQISRTRICWASERARKFCEAKIEEGELDHSCSFRTSQKFWLFDKHGSASIQRIFTSHQTRMFEIRHHSCKLGNLGCVTKYFSANWHLGNTCLFSDLANWICRLAVPKSTKEHEFFRESWSQTEKKGKYLEKQNRIFALIAKRGRRVFCSL